MRAVFSDSSTDSDSPHTTPSLDNSNADFVPIHHNTDNLFRKASPAQLRMTTPTPNSARGLSAIFRYFRQAPSVQPQMTTPTPNASRGLSAMFRSAMEEVKAEATMHPTPTTPPNQMPPATTKRFRDDLWAVTCPLPSPSLDPDSDMDSPSVTPSIDKTNGDFQFRDDLWAAACTPPSPSLDEDGVQWAEAAPLPISMLTPPPHALTPTTTHASPQKRCVLSPDSPIFTPTQPTSTPPTTIPPQKTFVFSPNSPTFSPIHILGHHRTLTPPNPNHADATWCDPGAPSLLWCPPPPPKLSEILCLNPPT